MVRSVSAILLSLVGLNACQSANPTVPAHLANTSEANVTALKSALASAMGQAEIELGAGDLDQETRIAVLPPALSPRDDRSPALPTYFDLMMKEGSCVAIHAESKNETPLLDVACRAVSE